VVRVLDKRLGALPVVAQFGRRLRIAEIIDELCPVRPVAWITHGEVIEALVANRLTAPAPLVRVQEWAAVAQPPGRSPRPVGGVRYRQRYVRPAARRRRTRGRARC
jgi:Domain of unknown function (DUF4277)